MPEKSKLRTTTPCYPARALSMAIAIVLLLQFVPCEVGADAISGAEAYKRGDYVTAARELRIEAEKGNALAQALLGTMYSSGKGVPKDEAQAASWHQKAAEQGNTDSQHLLGMMYDEGIGVPKDASKAAYWYQQAAEKGDDAAQSNLAILYFKGEGVPKDLVMGYFWANLAAAQGNENALENRSKAERMMTPEQISRAQQISSQWNPKQVAALPSTQGQSNSDEAPQVTSTGSGFFVDAEGHVITNFHVAGKCAALQIRLDDEVIKAKSQALDEHNDLALLLPEKKVHQQAVRFRADGTVRLAETVVLAGFPLRGLLSKDLNVTSGQVSSLAGPDEDTRLLQITAPVQPGNSGGPVLDSSGQLIGVVVGKLDALKVAEASGTLPENINFAIKAPIVRSFLDINGIKYSTATLAKPISAEEIAAQARRYTTVVECLQ